MVTAARNFETNCSLTSVSVYLGIPYAIARFSTNTVAVLVDATVLTGLALVSFVYRAFKTNTSGMLYFALGNGPRMSVAQNLS